MFGKQKVKTLSSILSVFNEAANDLSLFMEANTLKIKANDDREAVIREEVKVLKADSKAIMEDTLRAERIRERALEFVS